MPNGRCLLRPVEQIWRDFYPAGFDQECNGADNDSERQEGRNKADGEEFVVYIETKLEQHVEQHLG